MKLIIVTGLSGSGKSIAIRQLEDSGYYCIDNLPFQFLEKIIADLKNEGLEKIAVSIDARSHLKKIPSQKELSKISSIVELKVLFLTATTEELVRRYSESRRRHPLSAQFNPSLTLPEAIDAERKILDPFTEMSCVIDTTGMLSSSLRERVQTFIEQPNANMMLTFESFAFKKGPPVDADLLFDVRCLPNPFYVEELRALSGLDQPVKNYLTTKSDVLEMCHDLEVFLTRWIPKYLKQNRHYLTIAIGCTGGQHRSVFMAEELAERFKLTQTVIVRHRELEKSVSLQKTP